MIFRMSFLFHIHKNLFNLFYETSKFIKVNILKRFNIQFNNLNILLFLYINQNKKFLDFIYNLQNNFQIICQLVS
jgi:hypothetical protein